MLNRAIAATIAIVVMLVIGAGAADIPGNAELSRFDIAAFATFAIVAVVRIAFPAFLFAIRIDAE